MLFTSRKKKLKLLTRGDKIPKKLRTHASASIWLPPWLIHQMNVYIWYSTKASPQIPYVPFGKSATQGWSFIMLTGKDPPFLIAKNNFDVPTSMNESLQKKYLKNCSIFFASPDIKDLKRQKMKCEMLITKYQKVNNSRKSVKIISFCERHSFLLKTV
ncbi:hypothetical protein EGR_03736 [Echinococcus granulosus]|uniref:Uncharacterized protein n=1 Tax=Echinococcus granulosus TaxID=6210 RepID=W6UK00_ECHGR|nr:hypothetical protein EGR_03736 [Echinococcus granulosus]EUB61446.1 hypothetical protein EGR_03736 [Echinococcus granulosus]